MRVFSFILRDILNVYPFSDQQSSQVQKIVFIEQTTN